MVQVIRHVTEDDQMIMGSGAEKAKYAVLEIAAKAHLAELKVCGRKGNVHGDRFDFVPLSLIPADY
jgi:hypothetical protein